MSHNMASGGLVMNPDPAADHLDERRRCPQQYHEPAGADPMVGATAGDCRQGSGASRFLWADSCVCGGHLTAIGRR
jgi:hypothetical protein